TEEALLTLREDFLSGRFTLRTEETVFSLRAYQAFLCQHAASIEAFKTRQQAAFEAERERWLANNLLDYINEETLDDAGVQSELDLPAGAHAISADVTGTVWKLLVEIGQSVKVGDPVLV